MAEPQKALQESALNPMSCEDSLMADVLTRYRKIAVVGLSPNDSRPSYGVTEYMLGQGYEITGVRPGGHQRILDRPCFERIAQVPAPLEIVNVFRASEFIPQLVDELIPLKPKEIWLQLGISHPVAEAKARAAGIPVISDRCILVEHRRLLG